MRVTCLIPLLFVAACGSGAAEDNKAATAAADNLDPGQWELATEVTAFRAVDEGEPKINTPAGTRTTESVCVAADARPPAEFFAGTGYDCTYGSYYLRNGRVNLTLSCSREGLEGQISIATEGRFEAGSAEFTRDVRTILTGDGDVEYTQRVTARRTGECTPEAGGDNAAAPATRG